MGIKYRFFLVLIVFLFALSLFNFIQYFHRGEFPSGLFTDLLLYVVGLGFSLYMLRTPLYLGISTLAERWTLSARQREIQRSPRNSSQYLSQGVASMRLATYSLRWTLLLVSWDRPEKHTQVLVQRITKALRWVTRSLQALNTAYSLDDNSSMANRGRRSFGMRVTSVEERLSQHNLEMFGRFFPQEVDKAAWNAPGPALLHALLYVCNAIALNPLNAEAFESGRQLMTYMHREDIADAFQQVSTRIEGTQRQAKGGNPFLA